MPEIALFEPAEQWGGQAKTWTRLHDPTCYIYADYYGINIAGDWHTVSIDERRALVDVMQAARDFHLARVNKTERKLRPEPGTAQIDQGG